MGLSGHAEPSAVLGVTISFTILSSCAVLLRLYTRLFIVRSAGADDACIGIAGLLNIGLTVAQCFQVKYGMGRHLDSLTQYELITSLKPFWASIVIYNIALFFTKFSILLQYLRIFPYESFRRLCYALMVFVFAWSCWTIFSAIFFCTPVAFFWDKALQGTCLSEWAVWFANAGVNILSDIAVAVLPLPFLSQLQLPKRQKIALMIVFGLGGFTCIISILRLESLLVFLHNPDISWNNPLAAIWSSIEVNTGIICSCLPTLKALLTRAFPNLLHSTRGYLHGNNSHTQPYHHDNTYASANKNCTGRKNKLSFDALGKGLSGRERPMQSTFVRSGRSTSDEDLSEEVEFATRGKGRQADDRIQVVTVVEQEVEKGRRAGSNSSSTHELVERPARAQISGGPGGGAWYGS